MSWHSLSQVAAAAAAKRDPQFSNLFSVAQIRQLLCMSLMK
jgi:hypothetical protein